MINLVEKTKVLDTIYINTGLKMQHLNLANEQYNFDQDEDVKTLNNALQMILKKCQEDQDKMTILSQENIPVIEKALTDVGLT